MDPIPLTPSVPVDLATLLGVSGAQKEAQIRSVLLALVGQEMDVLFEATVPEGVKLRLPQGQVLVAQGDLPYPEGTVLRVQVLAPPQGETAPRLQALAAQVPPAPPILAPLLQGEAFLLLQKLQSPEPPPQLQALATFFKFLDAMALAPPPLAPGTPPEGPRQLPEIPAPLREPLAKVLAQVLPPESPEALVTRWIEEETRTALPVPSSAERSGLAQPTGSPGPSLLQDPTLPPRLREALSSLLEPGRSPAALPPDLRAPIAEALLLRMPAPTLERQVQQWLALTFPDLGKQPQVQAQVPSAAQAAVPGQVPPREGGAPASGEGKVQPPAPTQVPAALKDPLSIWLSKAPSEVRDSMLPLLRELATLPAPRTLPLSNAFPSTPPRSVSPTVPLSVQLEVEAALTALPDEARQTLSRVLGLPSDLPSPQAAQALWDATQGQSSLPRLEPADLPGALAKALSQTSLNEDIAPLRRAQVQALERELSTWPAPVRQDLSLAFAQAVAIPNLPASTQAPPPSSNPRDLAEALVRWIQTLGPEASTLLAPAGPDLPTPASKALLQKILPSDLPGEIEKLLDHPAFPADSKETARTWLKSLLPAPSAEAGSKAQSAPGEQAAPPLKELPLDPRTRTGLEARLALASPDALSHPEPWQGWVEASLRTLSNPQASPREAPFHALQALDGTAYFEIPLPGRASGPLQLWVEKDASPASPDAPPIHKILFGLRFTTLGETRVGMLQTAGSLSIKIWAEHPDALRGGEVALKENLEALGDRVSLRVAVLPQGSPTPRTLAVGPGYQGLA